jgi:hypothetical protein
MQTAIALPPRARWASLCTAIVLVLSCATFGCTETQIRSRRGRFNPEPLPRPQRIVVYDFDTVSTQVLLDPSIGKEIARGATPITEVRRQVALAVADVVSRTLVEEILALGLPAERGAEAPVPKQGALIVDGQLVRVDEGSRMKRATVGFGAGRSELRTQLQVYLIAARGRRLIADFETTTDESSSPGAGGAMAVTDREVNAAPTDGAHGLADDVAVDAKRTGRKAARVLAELFSRQGWISTGEKE